MPKSSGLRTLGFLTRISQAHNAAGADPSTGEAQAARAPHNRGEPLLAPHPGTRRAPRRRRSSSRSPLPWPRGSYTRVSARQGLSPNTAQTHRETGTPCAGRRFCDDKRTRTVWGAQQTPSKGSGPPLTVRLHPGSSLQGSPSFCEVLEIHEPPHPAPRPPASGPGRRLQPRALPGAEHPRRSPRRR